MPQPIDDFAAFTGQKPVDPADDFAAFTGKAASAPAPVAPAPIAAPPSAHVGALQSGFDPMAAGASVGNAIDPMAAGASVGNAIDWLKTVPGRLEQFAKEKEAENEAALQAQQAKLGKVGAYFYRTSILPPGLSLEDISESLKTLAQKGQRLWQAIKPNQAKAAAQNAEFEMQQRMKEIGGRPWTPRETLWFNQKKDLAKQMWAASETERAARKKAVQDFQERSANWIAPGTIKSKVMGTIVPLVAQATLAPETIPADMALNQLAQGQLNNPTQEQTFGQQAKEAAWGYGLGKFMMAGAPGVPVSRALQGLGVPAVAANVAGIIPTSVTNVLGGHELSRYLTTDHGEAPPVPGLQDYLTDMVMQAGLQGPHLGRSFTAPEGAPAISQPAEVAPLPGRPLETPTTPGSLNAPPVESRPLPAPLAQSSEPVRMPAQSLAQLGSMKPTEPQSPPFVGATSFEVPFKPGEPQTQNGVSVGGDQAALSHELLPPVAENVYRPQAGPEEGLPDAYGLAPVAVEPPAPTAYNTLHDHEAEMAMVKQQQQADREALVNSPTGPIATTSDIAPEHHAEADAILEARSIVTIAERKALDAEREILALQVKNRERVANGQEPKPIPSELAAAAKNRLAPDDPLRSLAAAAPSHPDVQRAMDVASELQRSLASEYAQGTPGAEGDITHAKREMLKSAPVQPTLSDKAKSFFFGIKPPAEEAPSVGIGKRPMQKDVSSNQRAYETVDGPTGPTVIYKGEPGDTEYNIVGRPGTIQEADITTRRESTKDEIEHATSQVVDPETGEVSLDPNQAIHFSRNAVASAASARETARAAARGRAVIDNLKANSDLFKPGEAVPGSGNRNVSDLPITRDIKGRLGDGNVPSDVANTLVEYFGEPGAREAGFWHWLDKSSRQWIERGFMTNPFIHFPNQFAHGLGALASEGMSPKQSMEALSHAYREGSNPNSEYVNRAKAAGVRQMSEGRVLGENANMTAHEVATAKLEAALGHEPGALGQTESGPIRNGFRALNQKAVWQVDDAIRNTLFYQKLASGMTPAQAAKYANENYVGYRTDTNLFELNHGQPTRLNKEGDPGHWLELAKKAANYAYSGLVTGKGQSGKGGFQGAGGTLARTLVAPLFSTFRTNSLELLGHEIKGAATDRTLGGLGKLANIATVGSAVAGAVGQTLSDSLLTDKEKKQGKEYRMRMGGPFHIYDTAEKALTGKANKYQTMAALATPNPIFKQIGKSMFGVDVSTGRRAPATSLAELGDTALSSVLPTGDIGRNALQGQGNARDMAASFFLGKNAPNEAAQIAMAHPDKQAAGTPDYENAKANYKLISTLRNLDPGTKAYSDAIQAALAEHILTTRQVENASKRSNQSELEHMRALGKITSLNGLMAMADSYAERSPQIANALYADLRQRAAKESQKLRGVDSLKALGQAAENKQRILRQ